MRTDSTDGGGALGDPRSESVLGRPEVGGAESGVGAREGRLGVRRGGFRWGTTGRGTWESLMW